MVLFEEGVGKGEGGRGVRMGWELRVMGEVGEGKRWEGDVF